eukprot:6566629-Pyramimonas_sp.AAC.1
MLRTSSKARCSFGADLVFTHGIDRGHAWEARLFELERRRRPVGEIRPQYVSAVPLASDKNSWTLIWPVRRGRAARVDPDGDSEDEGGDDADDDDGESDDQSSSSDSSHSSRPGSSSSSSSSSSEEACLSSYALLRYHTCLMAWCSPAVLTHCF